MSEDQKIWFVYLTDHHEGPFTLAEVSQKAATGLVNAQTLAWKDGMAEWVAIESIPELAPALGGGGAAPAAGAISPAPPGGGGGDDGLSLAAMLAASQGGGDASPEIMGSADSSAASQAAVSVGAAPADTAAAVSADAGNPDDGAEAWTLKVGSQVNGLFSMNALKEMAKNGEVPSTAMLWHAGWSDFQPLSSVPALAASAKSAKKSGGTKTGLTKSTGTLSGAGKKAGVKSGIAPITAGANVGGDDKTDPAISQPKGFSAVMAKLRGLFKKKKKDQAPAVAAAAKAALAGGKTATAITSPVKIGGGKSAAIRRILMILFPVVAFGGGVAYYVLFMMSPIPSDLDVSPDSLEQMVEVVKAPKTEGKLFMATAKGTEDNPADPSKPKYYVATNLDPGQTIKLIMSGVPGTLINRLRVERTFEAPISKHHYAVFENFKDEEGKPLPMGDYKLKVTAPGAQAIEKDLFFGGLKGADYQKRLQQYKDTLQKSYDEEVQELREITETLKSAHAEMVKQLAVYKQSGNVLTMRNKIINDWRNFGSGFQGMAGQIDAKLKAKLEDTATLQTRYYPNAYKDLATLLEQMQKLYKAQADRLAGQPSTTDELEGLTQAAVLSLTDFIGKAVVRSPLDALSAAETAKTPTPQGAPSAGATAPAATQPASGAPATAPSSVPPTAPVSAPAPAPTAGTNP